MATILTLENFDLSPRSEGRVLSPLQATLMDLTEALLADAPTVPAMSERVKIGRTLLGIVRCSHDAQPGLSG